MPAAATSRAAFDQGFGANGRRAPALNLVSAERPNMEIIIMNRQISMVMGAALLIAGV
jgi:hypothetical protein